MMKKPKDNLTKYFKKLVKNANKNMDLTNKSYKIVLINQDLKLSTIFKNQNSFLKSYWQILLINV